jgi:hypothetical protein
MRAAGPLVLACLFGLAALTGCSNNTGPTAGVLNLSLSSPHTDDGAVLLSITGGPIDSVEAVGYAVYTARIGLTLRLIVTGDIGPGPVARIHIPDGRQASRYTAAIGQVAARETYAQRDPAPYSASLLP